MGKDNSGGGGGGGFLGGFTHVPKGTGGLWDFLDSVGWCKLKPLWKAPSATA